MNLAFVSALPLGISTKKSFYRQSCRWRNGAARVSIRAVAAQPTNGAHRNGVDALTDQSNALTLIRRFADIPEKQRGAVALTVALGVLGAISSVCQPIVFSRTLNAVINLFMATDAVPNFTPLRNRLLVQLCIYVFEVLMTFFYIRQMSVVLDGLTARLRTNLYKSSLSNDLSFFDVEGKNVQRALTADIPELRGLLQGNLSSDRGLRSGITIVLGIMVCLVIDPLLASIVFVFLLPTLSIAAGVLGIAKKDAESKYADAETEVRFATVQALSAIRTVKANGAEAHELRQLKSRLARALSTAGKGSIIRARSEIALRVAVYATILTVFSVGGFMVATGRLPLARFLPLSSFMWILLFSLIGFVYTFADTQTMYGCLQRTFSVLDRAEAASKEKSDKGVRVPSKNEGIEVEFRNVSFAYPTRANIGVIRNLSFTMKPGSTVALVGPSGAGKSTIAALLARFYTPNSGAIFLNQVDIQSIGRTSYLGQLAFVDQDTDLFQGTIRENICYGRRGCVEDSEMEQAARDSNAHEFITALPDGYNTMLTAGSTLSGGQKQRIAIARAILRGASLLVLDEYSSALDSESELAVQDALKRLGRGRTVLIIAHRLSTIRSADEILVIDQGQISERGSYKNLMEQEGAFRALVSANSRVIVNE